MSGIGLVTTQLQRGGAERQLCQLALDLSGIGQSVSILSLMPFEQKVQDELLDGSPIQAHTLGLSRGIRGIRPRIWSEYRRWIRREEIKLGIYFNFHPILLGRLSQKFGLVPRAISAIRCLQFGGRFRERLIGSTDRWSSLNTCNSINVAERLIQQGIMSRTRFRYVPNGMNRDRLSVNPSARERLRKSFGFDSSHFVWLAAGRLEPDKDFLRLIEAMARVRTEHPNHRLLIAGEGRQREAMEASIRQLNLESQCFLLGEREDIPELMVAVDSYVLSSYWESMPNVLMEAQVLEIPIVTTDAGGAEEIVDNGVSGVVVPRGSTDHLTEGMNRLISLGEGGRRRLVEAGKRDVDTKFSRAVALERWRDVICETGHEL